MSHRRRLAGVIGIALMLAAAPALAHHGWSSYDSSRALTLDGVIKESGYERTSSASWCWWARR